MGDPDLLVRGMKVTVFTLTMFRVYLEGVQQASGEEPSQSNIFPEDNNITTFYLNS